MTMRVKLNYLLSFLIIYSLVFDLHASDTLKSVVLYTPFTKISVPPGESIDYSVELINQTEEVKTADIYLSGLPRGWTYELKSGAWNLKQLSVLPKEKKSFSLKIEVPLKVNKGAYRLNLSAGNEYTLPLTVVVSEQGTYQTEFTTQQPNMEGHAGSNFTFSANLRNRTGEKQLYALNAGAPRGWEVIFRAAGKQVSSVSVEANATESVTIEIKPPAMIEAGSYKIPVQSYTNATSAKLELEVVITGSYKLELTTPRGLLSSDITAGEEKEIELQVRNTGSSELSDIKLNANTPIDWVVKFDPEKIDKLPAGENAKAIARIKASKKAIPGDYVVKMDARTPESTSNADFRISVKTSMLWGWIGVLVIIGVLGGVYYLFRKYGRR